jgi:RNA polymerase sigma factor (sigma-70 family)
MDVFSSVCEALWADDLARLRRYGDGGARSASVATWLVAVVRNLTIDWLRHRDGRPRTAVPANLSALQREIHAAVCVDGCSYVEAYEVIRAHAHESMTFAEFLREVRITQRLAPCASPASGRRGESRERAEARERAQVDVAGGGRGDPAADAELAQRVAEALAAQPADVRLAIELFVVERMSAEDVARVVGWPNAKAVYNRVHRALLAMRSTFEREGIGRDDL